MAKENDDVTDALYLAHDYTSGLVRRAEDAVEAKRFDQNVSLFEFGKAYRAFEQAMRARAMVISLESTINRANALIERM